MAEFGEQLRKAREEKGMTQQSLAYGTCDKVQPFLASLRLKTVLEENGVDNQYFELPHSGHGLQNDNKISEQWIKTVEEYLNKYMPVK